MNESRRDDIEAIPRYQEHDMESSAVSLVSTAQSAFSPGEQAGQVRSGLDSWTTDDVVAWVRLNGGDESMEQVVRMEGMDGSMVRWLDADYLLSVFAFDTDAQRERMKNALVSLQSHDGNNEPPSTKRAVLGLQMQNPTPQIWFGSPLLRQRAIYKMPTSQVRPLEKALQLSIVHSSLVQFIRLPAYFVFVWRTFHWFPASNSREGAGNNSSRKSSQKALDVSACDRIAHS
ncbi:hypothetical protein BJ741DRAFT_706896 [Chytriomyces cf. hyalinus JEL632]|nr:hypothetical protein BJ741DRAFT_706896 [Chytriomyces cf. hyalinus JEL632]